MSLRAVNLNLVPILRALLREQHVSRAASSLNLTQPAVSSALAQLREILKDPLLVSVGRHMELTPRARGLIAQVEAACDALDGLWADPVFDPARAQRCFTIATADYTPLLIAARLTDRLARTAPGISIRFVDVMPELAFKSRGQDIDFVIAPRLGLAPFDYTDVHIETFFHDDFIIAAGPNHALAMQENTAVADYQHEPLVIFDPGMPLPNLRVVEFYGAANLDGPVRLRVQHFGVLRQVAATANCLALLPRRLLDLPGEGPPLRLIGNPIEPIDVEICLAWPPRHAFDPAHRWFRGLLREAVA